MDENFVFIQVKKVEEKLDTHTHTPESIDAAPANHIHTPASIGAAQTNHTHMLSDLPITYGTTDLTAGTSALETGKIYLCYE